METRDKLSFSLRQRALFRVNSFSHKSPPKDFAILCEIKSLRPVTMNSNLLEIIKHSVLKNRYEIHIDADGNPSGYFIWADACFETVYRLFAFGILPKYLHEWNEGRIRLFLDGSFPMGGMCMALRKAKSTSLLCTTDMIAFVHKERMRCYKRVGGRFISVPVRSLAEDASG